MFIERLQVEEGFLSGLDIHFTRGLNVIIGARGTGKTSIIELIRFCLGADGFTEDAIRRGHQQASAVLQGGIATVTVRDRDETFTISRSANGQSTSTSMRQIRCTVLAQNEVEAVGAQASGRLHLVDRYREQTEALASELLASSSQLRSMTAEIRGVLEEGLELARQVNELQPVTAALTAAQAEQQQLLDQAKATQEDQDLLSRLQSASTVLAARGAVYSRSEETVSIFRQALSDIANRPAGLLEDWPIEAGSKDLLAPLREELAALADLLQAASGRAAKLHEQFVALRSSDEGSRSAVEAESRRLRQSLEQTQAGVGAATRRVADLQERVGQLKTLNALLQDRRAKFVALSDKRVSVYDSLEAARDSIYEARKAVADALTSQLSPFIRITVTRSKLTQSYQSAILAGLRGSGLHYNSLAPLLAEKLSPFELVSWVEQGDVDELVRSTDLARDRALSIISALRSGNLPDIIASTIDDGVTFELLDGRDYKDSARLSIGQRCTVVLPVLLGKHGDPLLVDQPEDHLDNAFIATTLVASLLRRETSDQLIFTSHNANIPVLGAADTVIVMDSDGERGYVKTSGPLDDSDIVDAVTKIMEGGKQAFAARAKFYGASRTPQT